MYYNRDFLRERTRETSGIIFYHPKRKRKGGRPRATYHMGVKSKTLGNSATFLQAAIHPRPLSFSRAAKCHRSAKPYVTGFSQRLRALLRYGLPSIDRSLRAFPLLALPPPSPLHTFEIKNVPATEKDVYHDHFGLHS